MKSDSEAEVREGDCGQILADFADGSFDLVYLDPPFCTGKVHRLTTRDLAKSYSFNDLWDSQGEYAEFLMLRVAQLHRVLAPHGSIFFHCDRNSTHVARMVLDELFGADQFRAEIIWRYRRWTNSERRLLPAHQTILYYSKSDAFRFNLLREPYSPATNVDQILQRRTRNPAGKSAYERDADGEVVIGDAKQGVPLSDVWDIPYLNPKATERTGYPTQKPVLLLDRIIRIATNPGDRVLDPFCGSGTTLVAAGRLDRRAVGIDVSAEAVKLTRDRIASSAVTRSVVFEAGRESFQQADSEALNVLAGLDLVPVQRNRGIDAFLKDSFFGAPIPIRVQRQGESLLQAAERLLNASQGKGASIFVLVQTEPIGAFEFGAALPENVLVVTSSAHQVRERIGQLIDKRRRLPGA
jgi:site-specific DNA-methyltransferase (adenine-specific)